MELVDIVIPIYTPKLPLKKAEKCIKSVINNTKIPFNLILPSSDKSQPYNINQGLQRAKSKYVAILDWDIYVSENWLEPLVNVLKMKKNAGIVGCKMTGNYEKWGGLNSKAPAGITLWPTLAGGVMVFKNIGLMWDENFPSGYWADTDFCRQFKEKGYKVYINGDVEVKHDIYTSNTNLMITSYMNQGRQIYRKKWGDNEF
jgi:glycosyltransferase involved in cell wall biosynthesis